MCVSNWARALAFVGNARPAIVARAVLEALPFYLVERSAAWQHSFQLLVHLLLSPPRRLLPHCCSRTTKSLAGTLPRGGPL